MYCQFFHKVDIAARNFRPCSFASPPVAGLPGGNVLLSAGWKFVQNNKEKLNIKTTHTTPKYEHYKYRLYIN